MPDPAAPATPQAPAAGAPTGTPPAPATPAPPATPAAAPAAAPAATPAQAAPGSPEAAKAAADAAILAAQQGTPWYKELPAETHEQLKDFATPDDAVAAIKAGQQYTQAKEVNDYNFTFDDPNIDMNNPAITSYKQFCLDNNISPEQAQKTLEYQTGIMNEASVAAKGAGEAQLRADWGNNFDVNLAKSLTALTAIDMQTGGTLAAKLKMNGGANDPDIIKALFWVSERIGEDNLGAGGPGGGPDNRPVSTEDAYAELFGNK